MKLLNYKLIIVLFAISTIEVQSQIEIPASLEIEYREEGSCQTLAMGESNDEYFLFDIKLNASELGNITPTTSIIAAMVFPVRFNLTKLELVSAKSCSNEDMEIVELVGNQLLLEKENLDLDLSNSVNFEDEPIITIKLKLKSGYDKSTLLNEEFFVGGSYTEVAPLLNRSINEKQSRIVYVDMTETVWNNSPMIAESMAATIPSSTLPVELIEFTAEAKGDQVELHWRTASETDNDYFAIERSSDGKAFEQIGQMLGRGSVWTTTEYQYTDRFPLSGPNYYRLKQMDKSGSYSYTPIRIVEMDGLSNVMKIYPNPSRHEFNVQMIPKEGSSLQLELQIFNALGQKVLDRSYEGEIQDKIQIETKGVYTLIVNNTKGRNLFTEKIIVVD